MIEKFHKIIGCDDDSEKYFISSLVLNSFFLFSLLALIVSTDTIILLYYAVFKVVSILIISVMYFSLLNKLNKLKFKKKTLVQKLI